MRLVSQETSVQLVEDSLSNRFTAIHETLKQRARLLELMKVPELAERDKQTRNALKNRAFHYLVFLFLHVLSAVWRATNSVSLLWVSNL